MTTGTLPHATHPEGGWDHHTTAAGFNESSNGSGCAASSSTASPYGARAVRRLSSEALSSRVCTMYTVGGASGVNPGSDRDGAGGAGGPKMSLPRSPLATTGGLAGASGTIDGGAGEGAACRKDASCAGA